MGGGELEWREGIAHNVVCGGWGLVYAICTLLLIRYGALKKS